MGQMRESLIEDIHDEPISAFVLLRKCFRISIPLWAEASAFEAFWRFSVICRVAAEIAASDRTRALMMASTTIVIISAIPFCFAV
jgi:hypothetical protein